MGEFSLSPYQLPNYRSLHRFERWQISHQIVGNSFRRTPAQTHQGQNANSLPGKCGQSLKFSLWAKGPIGKYGSPRYCGWACPFDPGSYLDHYSSLPNPGHYYGKNFDLIQFFLNFDAVYISWEKLEFHKKLPTFDLTQPEFCAPIWNCSWLVCFCQHRDSLCDHFLTKIIQN